MEEFYDESEEEREDLEEERAETLKFALENHLRDFLAKNLDIVEPGLNLYNKDGCSGIEFSIDGGRIDILATDKNGAPVVFELKLSAGRKKALGQLLYYMGWVDKNLDLGRSRGIIVAKEIDPELQLAVSRVSGVELVTYNMQFTIEKLKKNNYSKRLSCCGRII